MSTSSISTGLQSTGQLIRTGRNRINAVTVMTDGTNTATLALYDNLTASGKLSVRSVCIGANQMQHIIFEKPVLFENGIYAAIAGSGATFIVYFGG